MYVLSYQYILFILAFQYLCVDDLYILSLSLSLFLSFSLKVIIKSKSDWIRVKKKANSE